MKEWLLCAGPCAGQCWDATGTHTALGPALTGLSDHGKQGKKYKLQNVGLTEKEDKVRRLDSRKTRQGLGIWEGFPVEVIVNWHLRHAKEIVRAWELGSGQGNLPRCE